jgi:hypothetical protein
MRFQALLLQQNGQHTPASTPRAASQAAAMLQKLLR